MVARDVPVVNEHGIHARPAAAITRTAGRFKADIKMAKDGLEINAKSIMGVMMMAAECGSVVTITATGPDAAEAVEALAALFASKFGES